MNSLAHQRRAQNKYFRKLYRVNLVINDKPHYKLIWANTADQAKRMLGDYWKPYITDVVEVTDFSKVPA